MIFTQITMIDYSKPLKARAASRKRVGPYMWQPVAPCMGRGFYQASNSLAMDRAGSTFSLRLQHANDLWRGAYRKPDAYSVGAMCEDYFHPIVARLPHGRGFLSGWTMGAGMAASLDNYIWDTEHDAALAAHDAAESAAESEAEYQMRELARAESENDQ